MGDIFGTDKAVEEREKSYLDAQEQLEIAMAQYKEDLAAVASTPEGERLLRNIIAKGNVYNQGVVLGTNDMYFNEGRRALAIELISDLSNAVKPNKLFNIILKQE